MTRTANGPRKTEFVGIPLDKNSKRRLKAVAAVKRRSHTELARDYVMTGIERDEQQATETPAK